MEESKKYFRAWELGDQEIVATAFHSSSSYRRSSVLCFSEHGRPAEHMGLLFTSWACSPPGSTEPVLAPPGTYPDRITFGCVVVRPYSHYCGQVGFSGFYLQATVLHTWQDETPLTCISLQQTSHDLQICCHQPPPS